MERRALKVGKQRQNKGFLRVVYYEAVWNKTKWVGIRDYRNSLYVLAREVKLG